MYWIIEMGGIKTFQIGLPAWKSIIQYQNILDSLKRFQWMEITWHVWRMVNNQLRTPKRIGEGPRNSQTTRSFTEHSQRSNHFSWKVMLNTKLFQYWSVVLISRNLPKSVKSLLFDWWIPFPYRYLSNIRKALSTGEPNNVAFLESPRFQVYRTYVKNLKVYIHPSSALYKAASVPKYLIYHETVTTSRNFMRTVSICEKTWLPQLLPV